MKLKALVALFAVAASLSVPGTASAFIAPYLAQLQATVSSGKPEKHIVEPAEVTTQAHKEQKS